MTGVGLDGYDPPDHETLFASLADAGLQPSEWLCLTDRQIQLVYCHPRDKDGRPAYPRAAVARLGGDPAKQLAQAVAFMKSLGAPEAKVREYEAAFWAREQAKHRGVV